jgi:hypothetical protein
LLIKISCLHKNYLDNSAKINAVYSLIISILDLIELWDLYLKQILISGIIPLALYICVMISLSFDITISLRAFI